MLAVSKNETEMRHLKDSGELSNVKYLVQIAGNLRSSLVVDSRAPRKIYRFTRFGLCIDRTTRRRGLEDKYKDKDKDK
jgi:hypothetical protein